MRTPNRLLLAVTLVGSLLAHVPAAAQQDGPVYVVVVGDTLFGIAIRFGTTVEALAAANGISGIETAIGLLLAAVAAGQLTLVRAIEALTSVRGYPVISFSSQEWRLRVGDGRAHPI